MAVGSTETFPGPLCESHGISSLALGSSMGLITTLSKAGLTKGIALELNKFRSDNNFTWDDFYGWISELYSDDSSLPSLSVLRVSVGRIEKKAKELKRNKRLDKIQALKDETLINPSRSTQSKNDCESLQCVERLEELQSCSFKTQENKQKYLDDIRHCCIELLSLNVGLNNVDPIIRCVLKYVAGLEVDKLPHTSTLDVLRDEGSGMSAGN